MEKLNGLVFLLLIDRVHSFRNSYQLIKVLSWKFGIWEFLKVSDYLIENKLVEKRVIKQIGNYSITEMGRSYLLKEMEYLYDTMITTYPNEIAFIKLIFEKEADV